MADALPTIPQDQADDAAADAARWWPEFWRRWPWTRQQSLMPVYRQIGETAVSQLRAFPAIQWSNQALWYRRVVRDTPAVYVLFPEEFAAQAAQVLPGGDPRQLEGKSVLSFIYLTPGEGGATEVAKTLLASTDTAAPHYTPQLAHELLNCSCAAEYDGRTLRSGVRRANWGAGAMLQSGGALNDLLLDALLVDFLPRWTDVTLDALTGGMLGPYWEIARAFAGRLGRVPVREALFGPPDRIPAFERALDAALNLTDAAAELDALLLRRDWEALRAVAVGP